MAVNDTPIRTFGKRSLTLNLGLRRPFPLGFSLSQMCNDQFLELISFAILAFLSNVKQRQLSDATTQLHVQGILSSDSSPSPTIQPKDTGDPYNKLLSKFPSLTQVCSQDTPILHDVTHHIDTTGPPVTARPRRLPPERLKVAKREFETYATARNHTSLIQCLGITSPHGTQEGSRRLASLWRLPCIKPQTLSLIDIQFPTYTTSQLPCKALPSFRSWTWCAPIIRYLSTRMTSIKPPSRPLSVYSSFYACLLACGTRHRRSNVLWIRHSEVSHLCTRISTMF